VVSGLVWLLIILWLNPAAGGWVGYVLFFLSLFVVLSSVASLIGYGVRRVLLPRQLPAYSVRISLRQALLVGLFTNILLFLQLLRVLQWWLTIILILFFVVIESMFLSYDRAASRHRHAES
ncbi:MAG TPA: hypothetical protein VFC07_03120, partial [Verrucomicrobiae bacterium]|nr:hypothetical protein [Verrucomicrobiae bacterium]